MLPLAWKWLFLRVRAAKDDLAGDCSGRGRIDMIILDGFRSFAAAFGEGVGGALPHPLATRSAAIAAAFMMSTSLTQRLLQVRD